MKKNKIPDNILELIPEKNIKWDKDEDGKIYLIKEKTSNIFLNKVIEFLKKDKYFKIHLDKTGSSVWGKINGRKTILEICEELKNEFGDEFYSAEERVSFFVSLMKKNKFVNFV
ncbi:MAG: PqqD family protein [Acidobacteriota bacterium]